MKKPTKTGRYQTPTAEFRMKRHDRVLEKIGRLKERYSGVASQYKIRIERTGDTATAVRFKRQDKADLADAAAGSCVLRTGHTDWDAEKILRTYWRLTDLENTFRQLKSELGLRPIWHSTDARISAHLFITVLAYHAVHLIRTRLRNNDINLRRDSIRNRMASWERITTTQQTPTGQQVVVRQDARPSDEAATIARHVNVHVGPIGSACNPVTHPICKLIPPQNWRDSARARKNNEH